MKPNNDMNSDIENHLTTDENEGMKINKSDSEALPDAAIELNDLVAKLEADITVSNDKYLRLYSEFENYKRRVSKERIEQSKMAAADIFLSFIPIIDDLERALKSTEEVKDNESIREGVKLIFTKIKSVTAAKGLKEMESIGKPFDADLHDAIANMPASNEKQKGIVVEEIEKGYFLNDKVIRHAKVIVAI
jgi:molecular chaperone GrpE